MNMACDCYDKEGKPISLKEWGFLIENTYYRRIRETFVGPYKISTLWLGVDHNFFGGDEIHIFETMIFCDAEKDNLHCHMERCSTLEEAIICHEKTVKLLQEKQMKTEEMKEVLEAMKSLLEMKDKIEEMSKKLEGDIEEKEDGRCPIEIELDKEYNDIVLWAFGKMKDPQTKGISIEQWKKLHPDLPIPRILNSTTEHPISNTFGMLIDVAPLYYKHKNSYNRSCKCDNAN